MQYRPTLLPRFVIASLAVHLLLFLLWPKYPEPLKPPRPISVEFLPAPEKPRVQPPAAPAPTRPSNIPAQIAKKDSLLLEEQKIARRDVAPRKGRPRPEEAAVPPRDLLPPRQESKSTEQPPVERSQNQYSIVERSLPSLKELLPPVTWPPSGGPDGASEGAVRLDTREPKYISYFTSIKRAIELVWEYPEPALRYGLQGKLLLEFTILANGELDKARLLRSSGISVLDEEALRAVKAASPFHPIPPWIGKRRLDILATFEYLDNRLNYRFTP